MPPQFQELLVASNPGTKAERCATGHSPFLSQPDRVVEVLCRMAAEPDMEVVMKENGHVDNVQGVGDAGLAA